MATHEELTRAFVQCHRGRLLFVDGQWIEAIGSHWVEIPKRKVNRLIRNAGWPTACATSVRTLYLQNIFAHSGPLPAVATERSIRQPLIRAVTLTPTVMAFIERHAGRMIYDQESTWWLKQSEHHPGKWLPLYDREVNRLIREIVGTSGVVKVRRDLENSIWFAVKGMS